MTESEASSKRESSRARASETDLRSLMRLTNLPSEKWHACHPDRHAPQPALHRGIRRDSGDVTGVSDDEAFSLEDAIHRDSSGIEEINDSAIRT